MIRDLPIQPLTSHTLTLDFGHTPVTPQAHRLKQNGVNLLKQRKLQ